MEDKAFDNGMYIIDEDYHILYFNHAAGLIYPELAVGDICYKAMGCLDFHCPHCPLHYPDKLESVFYNIARKEWITAWASNMELPSHGICHSIQFKVKKHEDSSGLASEDSNQLLTSEILSRNDNAGLLSCYCEEGFPLHHASEKMASLMGYESVDEMTEAIGGLVINMIHPDDLPQVMKDMGDFYYPGMVYETTYRIPRKDGTWFWTVEKGQVVEADDGRLVFVCICSDMTRFLEQQQELLRQNEHLMQSNNLWTTALANMPGGYHRCSTKEGYPFLYISDRFTQMLGWSKEEIETLFDNKYANLIHPDDMRYEQNYADMVRNIGKGNAYDEQIYRLRGKQGYRWIIDTTMLVDMGESSFFQGTIADVTDFVEKEAKQQKDLADALRAAEAANHAKTNFLFNMSHDIRTPMNAILGFSAVAEKNIDDRERVLDSLQKLDLAGEHLLRLINDVLDMARIESGRIEFDVQAYHIPTVMAEKEPVFSSEIQRKNLHFTVQTDITDEIAFFDLLRMEQIELNLISNAVKYTPEGGSILYSVRQTASENGYATYVGTVKDNGIGMSQEFLKHAFEAFERERPSTVTGLPGTGLGLAITKKLLEQIGGSISCKSEPGVGTEFTFQVRLRIGTEADIAVKKDVPKSKADFNGKHILLAEDNALNREIACELLENLGFFVDTAEDGVIAVDMAARSQPGYYDLILMDIQMPNMDGYKATQMIRGMKDKRIADIPIVAMTANAFEEDRKNALASGMNEHIAKPINMRNLVDTLKKVLPV